MAMPSVSSNRYPICSALRWQAHADRDSATSVFVASVFKTPIPVCGRHPAPIQRLVDFSRASTDLNIRTNSFSHIATNTMGRRRLLIFQSPHSFPLLSFCHRWWRAFIDGPVGQLVGRSCSYVAPTVQIPRGGSRATIGIRLTDCRKIGKVHGLKTNRDQHQYADGQPDKQGLRKHRLQQSNHITPFLG